MTRRVGEQSYRQNCVGLEGLADLYNVVGPSCNGSSSWNGFGNQSARIALDDSSHGRTSTPGFPHRGRIYTARGRRRYDCYSRAWLAGDFAGLKLTGRGVHLGAPLDGPHEASGWARPRRGMAL